MSLKSKDANVLGLESHLLSEDQRNRPGYYGSEGSLIQHLKLKHHEYYLAHLQKQGAQGSQQESIHE